MEKGEKNMTDRFRRDQVLTIPNLFSLLRLAMIPVIVTLYRRGNYSEAAAMVALSGLTDLADGYIARKFHCVSDVGKILDPVADKLTLGAVILCLVSRFENMLWLLVVFTGKELVMAVVGIIVIQRKDMVNSAQWFGKAATLALYAMALILFLFPGVPKWAANGMMIGSGALVVISLCKYTAFYRKLLKGNVKLFYTEQNE